MDILGNNPDLTKILACWGALLSTILCVVKLSEVWKERFNIEVDRILRGCADMGHDIGIKNLSSKPVLLEYMEIYSKKGRWPFRKRNYIWSPEDSWLNSRIEPHDTKVYNFSQGEYFPWSGRKVYIRLHFAGRKPFVLSIDC